MARMIPAQIDDDVVSSAERRVFHLLATDPDTNGWIVLHSLGLARRTTGPYGEIDFVVIIPHEGILCLEIKGGAGVMRKRDMADYGSVREYSSAQAESIHAS